MNARGLIRLFWLLQMVPLLAGTGHGAGLPVPLIQGVINAPNPFDSRLGGLAGETQIHHALTADSTVHVTIYDLFGFEVKRWTFNAGDTGGRAGDNAFLWDGCNASGQKVAKGGYIAAIEADSPSGSFTTRRKIGVIH